MSIDAKRTWAPLAQRAAFCAALVAAWAAGFALIERADRTGQHDPACATFFTICPGEAQAAKGWLAASVVVLTLVLRPWSYRASWRRARVAAALALGAANLGMVVTMHGSAVAGAYLRWLYAMAGALLVAGLWSAWRAGEIVGFFRDWREFRAPAT